MAKVRKKKPIPMQSRQTRHDRIYTMLMTEFRDRMNAETLKLEMAEEPACVFAAKLFHELEGEYDVRLTEIEREAEQAMLDQYEFEDVE